MSNIFTRFYKFLKFKIDDYNLKSETFHFPKLTKKIKKKRLYISNYIFNKTNGYVAYGPFCNVKLIANSSLANTPCIILGSYENELHPFINNILASPPNKIIDIGSSLGYYIVGFAKNTSNSIIVGFEMVEEYRINSMELAKYNDVYEKIKFRSKCKIEELSEEVEFGCLILCDCEGFEFELLDPSKVKKLVDSTIICEVHEFYNMGNVSVLIERFKNTHDIKIIDQANNNYLNYPILNCFSDTEVKLAIYENRFINHMQATALKFLIMKPKSK